MVQIAPADSVCGFYDRLVTLTSTGPDPGRPPWAVLPDIDGWTETAAP